MVLDIFGVIPQQNNIGFLWDGFYMKKKVG